MVVLPVRLATAAGNGGSADTTAVDANSAVSGAVNLA
jgi:hypothetical protein